MATTLQLRRGTAAEAAAFTGADGELFVDTENNRVYLHDGSTPGGVEVLNENTTTTQITEGTNLYYTDARVQAAISADSTLTYASGVVGMPNIGATPGQYGSASEVPIVTVDAQGRITDISTTSVAGVDGFTYVSGTNTFTISTADGGSFSASGDLGAFTTTNLAEGTNLYYTDARVQAAVSATDAGGDGSFTYTAGVFTYTGPSAAETQAHFSAGSGLDYSAGEFSHADTSTQASVDNIAGSVIQDITLDDFGHITALGSVDLDDRYYTETEADSKFVDVAGDTMTGFLTLHADPTSALHSATKRYVDEVAQGISAKPAVKAGTTENLSGTYDNGTAGVGATLDLGLAATLTIDGISDWSVYDGILLKDQTNAFENGRYYVSQVGNDTDTNWILTRCGYCDEAVEIPSGYVFIQDGTINAGTGWIAVVNDIDTFTVGTDDITWFQFSGAGTYTAGTGLTLSSTEFSITNTAVTSGSYGAADTVATFTVNAQGQLSAAADVAIAIASSAVSGLASSATTDTTNASNISSGTLSGLRGVNAGSTSDSFVRYTGTTNSAGYFNGGTSNPSSTNRLNYAGYFYATRFYGDGSNVTALNADNISSGTLSAARLATSGVSAGTYGSGDEIPQITVDTYGRVTSATTVALAGLSNPSSITSSTTYPANTNSMLIGPITTSNSVILTVEGNLSILGEITLGTSSNIVLEAGASLSFH